ncbi:casein kinase 2 regulatory subunit [Pleurotus pulmonarius]|nr:casein kinase 2 regulatory subunit [Pleurotus pulmonarius]
MSRQAPSNEPSRAELEEEEQMAPGEGDEIMEEEEIEEQEDGYTSSTPTSTLTWISWFCSLPGHEYFCEVTEDFIEDDFNLTGLNGMVPFWKEAMEMVLDVEPDEDASKIPDVSIVESSAELLYGLVHQRFILTRAGLQAMVEKYESGIFGSCPRVYCVGTKVVPCGKSDMPGFDTVKLFCPNCNDIYVPRAADSKALMVRAFFGTTFAHLFFQSYRELAPAPFWKAPPPGSSPRSGGSNGARGSPFVNPNPHGGQKRAAGYVYVPRIYGFKVSERAKSGPRMQWLRLRPESPSELDMVDWRGRWLDEDDDFDDDDDDVHGGERQLEDFDNEPAEGDDDEEEEEEEEDAPQSRHMGSGRQRRLADPSDVLSSTTGSTLPSLTTTQISASSARTSPTSSVALRTPVERSVASPMLYTTSPSPSSALGKVRVIRQWQTGAAQSTPKVQKAKQEREEDMARTNLSIGANKGHPTTPLERPARPSTRKGVSSQKTQFVRSVIREVAGFSPYERRVMELLRNSKDKRARKLTKKRLGTLLRSKRKLEELGNIIQESRRAH